MGETFTPNGQAHGLFHWHGGERIMQTHPPKNGPMDLVHLNFGHLQEGMWFMCLRQICKISKKAIGLIKQIASKNLTGNIYEPGDCILWHRRLPRTLQCSVLY